MLKPQITSNLLKQVRVSLEFVGHGYGVHLDVVPIALAQRQSYSDYDYSEGDKLD